MLRRRLLSGLALSLLAACAGVGVGTVDQPPRVGLADVSLADFGLFEQRLDLALSIQNPNAGVMEVRGLNYSLEVNGQAFAAGVASTPLRIDAHTTGTYHAEARTTLGSVFRQLQGLARGGRDTIDYRLHGDLEVTGLGRVPFEQRGDLPLPGLLGPLFDAPQKAPAPRGDRA